MTAPARLAQALAVQAAHQDAAMAQARRDLAARQRALRAAIKQENAS